ncbi:MAG: hypothetical protein D6741_09545 [Planctomycetota bacterium]|nr:MAG: hypothetical protein D6741_09545 [Planctomycetota bacterium]
MARGSPTNSKLATRRHGVRRYRVTMVVAEQLCRLHADQRGVMSIVSVFTLLLLTILLGMVMNVGRAVDGKIRLQNAADAATYSGGAVIARGMNALAFTNHLMCDVFALTAFMREARDRNAEQFVPAILDAWEAEGPVFGTSGFPKFEALAPAITQKVPLERQLVQSFGDWGAAASAMILPTLEYILANELIPEYQRSVVATFPDMAQAAVLETARRHGNPDNGRGELLGVLWRTNGVPVGGSYEYFDRTLPVVDPVLDMMPNQAEYLARARDQRKSLARRYLNAWNNEAMRFFDREAKMSQFGSLWRSFTCGQLEQLLEEHEFTNLPFLIRTEKDDVVDSTAHLEEEFTFLGVVYWKPMRPIFPGFFSHTLDSDSIAYAQVRVFVPRRRLVWLYDPPGGGGPQLIGGIPGDFPELPGDEPEEPVDPESGHWYVGRERVPEAWNLLTQHWTTNLVPATSPAWPTVLQTQPTLPVFAGRQIRLPNLSGLDADDLQQISPH